LYLLGLIIIIVVPIYTKISDANKPLFITEIRVSVVTDGHKIGYCIATSFVGLRVNQNLARLPAQVPMNTVDSVVKA